MKTTKDIELNILVEKIKSLTLKDKMIIKKLERKLGIERIKSSYKLNDLDNFIFPSKTPNINVL